MIITCEKCDISFNLDESLLKPSGSKVRCSKCKHVFTAYPPAPEKEPEIPEEVKETAPDLEPEEDLDFSGLEQMLEPDDVSKDEADTSGKDHFEADAATIDDDVEEEIDIAGLENLLDSDDSGEVEETSAAGDELEDLNLSFDLEEPDEAEAVADEDEEEDLDLSLDLEEPDEAEAVADADDEEDLDLSLDLEESDEAEEVAAVDDGLEDLEVELDDVDPEKTLESDLLSTKTVSAMEQDSDELDLELDIDEEPEELKETDEELIDLAELEKTLEMEMLSPTGDDDSDREPENVELELADEEDIDEETEEIFEQADEADVSDIEQMLEMDSDTEKDAVSDEIELEFDIDGKQDDDQVRLEPDTTFVDEKEPAVSKEKAVAEDVVKMEVKGARKEKPVKDKKVSTPVAVLIALVLFVCAVVGGYFLLESQGIIPGFKELNIPYVSDLFTTGSKKDLGAVEAIQGNIKSEFVDNSMLGKLFVISGQVKNSTSKTHHSVKVTAKLYAAGKKLAKTKTVYAGNKLSREELASNDLVAINKSQANRFSGPGQPIRIKPGGQIPFMIIIPNLPENLEEYKVMVSESTPE